MFEAGPDLSDLKLATAALAAVAGFVFLALHFLSGRRAAQPIDWPNVTGVVTRTKITRRWGIGTGILAGGLWWVPDVTYRYEVGGKTYTGRHVFSSETGFPKKAGAKDVADLYPTGSAVTVFYNPVRPKRAYLRQAPARGRSLGAAILFFAIAAAALAAG